MWNGTIIARVYHKVIVFFYLGILLLEATNAIFAAFIHNDNIRILKHSINYEQTTLYYTSSLDLTIIAFPDPIA